MSNTISPNMGLIIPGVGTELGPTWATDLNASLSILDSHNHSSGQGVQITPNGLNINSDLTFINNNAINLRSTRYTSQASALVLGTDLGCISNINGNLYWNNNSGTAVQITSGSSIVGTAGSISGLPSGTASASYASGTFVWQSATNTSAVMDAGSVILRNNTANSKGLTLNPPNAMASNYSLTLPSLPGSTSFLQIDNSGNITAGATTANGLTPDNMAPRGFSSGINPPGPNYFFASASCGNFTTASTSYVNVTNLNVQFPINSNNGLVWIGLVPDGTTDGYIQSQTSDFLHIQIVDTTTS